MVVEDDAFIALDIEQALRAAGYADVRAFGRKASALSFLEGETPALALLDLNLGRGETSIDIAVSLKALGCPFMFLTGYTEATVPLPPDLSEAPRLSKPFDVAELTGAVEGLAGSGTRPLSASA